MNASVIYLPACLETEKKKSTIRDKQKIDWLDNIRCIFSMLLYMGLYTLLAIGFSFLLSVVIELLMDTLLIKIVLKTFRVLNGVSMLLFGVGIAGILRMIS